MHSLKINGERIADITEILKHEVNFYKDLYTSTNLDIETYVHT